MSDNIIYPKSFAAIRADRGAEAKSERPSRPAGWLVRLSQVETSPGKGPVFARTTDRIAAARAIGKLVSEAKSVGVSGEQIKEHLESEARPGKGRRPGTARLDRYMLSTKLSDQEAQAKSKKLQQRVRGYLEAASAIAELINKSTAMNGTSRDIDDVKAEVLLGTSLWSRPLIESLGEDERAAHLALGLSEMCQHVIRRSKLSELFVRTRQVPGVWDVTNERFVASKIACLFQSAYVDWYEHWTEAPPLPSVPLVRCIHAVFMTKARIAHDGTTSALSDGSIAAGFEGEERDVMFHLFREIRLALGPTTSPEAIGPMFESRARLMLSFAEEPAATFALRPSFTMKPVDDLTHLMPAAVFQVKIGASWRRVLSLEALDDCTALVFKPGDDPAGWAPNPLDPRSLPYEHWYFSWIPINEETVRYWLDRPIGQQSNIILCAPKHGDRETPAATWYLKPSAAHEIEIALASGALEKALITQVDVVRAALKQREDEWRRDATAATSDLIEMWRSDQGPQE